MNIDNTIALENFNNKKIKLDKTTDAKLKEQTDAFESFLLKQIFDISLKSENKLFGKDAGDKIYQSMYNDTMSKALAGGLGFSELLFNYLKENS